MGLLKKGSKGKEVEALQTKLNSFGAKPKLKVDGIFGPLTEKALKAAQSKLKLKTDGKAGDETMAALKFGRPLPVWDLKNYAVAHTQHKTDRMLYETQALMLENVTKELKTLNKLCEMKLAALKTMLVTNKAPRESCADLAWEIVKQQNKFEKQRIKSPTDADAALTIAKGLEQSYESLLSVVASNLKRTKSSTVPLQKAMNAHMQRVDAFMDNVNSTTDALSKSNKKLAK